MRRLLGLAPIGALACAAPPAAAPPAVASSRPIVEVFARAPVHTRDIMPVVVPGDAPAELERIDPASRADFDGLALAVRARVRHCHAAQPDAVGAIVLRFQINPNGDIDPRVEARSTLPASLVACVVEELRKGSSEPPGMAGARTSLVVVFRRVP
ncbi:MAG: hypothetical protein JST00_29050 [Deltaproteobacteria bacterium]|nr:hypothetical protein [Deltaproteobacteria bacterium]